MIFFDPASFILALREGIEAALVIGIMLAYTNRTAKKGYNRYIYTGTLLAILASVVLALAFNAMRIEFEGFVEEVFEGTMMITAAVILSSMILWMAREGRHLKERLSHEIGDSISKTHIWGLTALSFIIVVREGIETVLFLGAQSLNASGVLSAGVIGLAAAAILGYVVFKTSISFSLRKFFSYTSIVLLLFSAGLVAHGIHEFNEAGIIPSVVEHMWDINWFIDENGSVGSFLKALFGYNGNPSLTEIAAYLLYMVLLYGLYRWHQGRRISTKTGITAPEV